MRDVTRYIPNNTLVIGLVVSDEATVAKGQKLTEGQLVKLNETNELIVDDGLDPKLAYGIMAEDVDSTLEAKKTVLYVYGQFNKDAISYPEGKTSEDYKFALKDKGILLTSVVRA